MKKILLLAAALLTSAPLAQAIPTRLNDVVLGGDVSGVQASSSETGTIDALNVSRVYQLQLTGASPVTLRGFAGGTKGKEILVINNTGDTILIKNDDAGAPSGNRIFTGTGDEMEMGGMAAFRFVYDGSHWLIAGGGGGGTKIIPVAPIEYDPATKELSMEPATNSVDGYLTAADHTAFAGKEGAIAAGTTAQYWRGDKSWQDLNTAARGAFSATGSLTYNSSTGAFGLAGGNLTAGSGLSVTGGTGAVIGSGATVGIASGFYLPTTADQTAWNAKQAAGNYITALTGEVTAAGPGSAAATVSNSAVIGKVLTGYAPATGPIAATDTILQGIQKNAGNLAEDATRASWKNYVKNPGAEIDATTGVITGGGVSAPTQSNPLFINVTTGSQTFSTPMNTAGGYIRWELNTLDKSLLVSGATCEASLDYGTDAAADPGFVFDVIRNGVSVAKSGAKVMPWTSAGNRQTVKLFFDCGTNTTFPTYLEVRKNVINNATLYADNLFAGEYRGNTPAQVVVGGQWVGAINFTGCSQWTNGNATTWANFAAASGCTITVAPGSQGITAPTTQIPGFGLSGESALYRFEATGFFGKDATSGVAFRFSDGTLNSQEISGYQNNAGAHYGPSVVGTLNYGTDFSGKTIQIQGISANTPGAVIYADGPNLHTLTINVYKFPKSSSLAGTLITKDPVTKIAPLATRVTGAAPTKVGEYRSYLRSGGTLNWSETNGSPSTPPSAANGFYINSTTSYAGGDSSGNPTRFEIFVGKNKVVNTKFYSDAGKTGYIDVAPKTYSGEDYGFVTSYDETTGILFVSKYSIGNATMLIGHKFASGGGTVTQVNSTVYFEVETYDNPLAAGLSEAKDEALFTGGAGYGSTNTNVRRYVSLTTKGDALSCTQSSTLGDSCEVKKAGQYTIHAGERAGSGTLVSVITSGSVGAALTTLDRATVAPYMISSELYLNAGTTNDRGSMSTTVNLPVGAIIRWQEINSMTGINDGIGSIVRLRITKTPSPFETVGAASGGLDMEPVYSASVSASGSIVSDRKGLISGSVGYTNPGLYALTFPTGKFSAKPECTVKANNGGGFISGYPMRDCWTLAPATSSGVTVVCAYDGSGSTVRDNLDFTISCQGPK